LGLINVRSIVDREGVGYRKRRWKRYKEYMAGKNDINQYHANN
jgi:hypothetical protein